ncbi:hypothetical protein ABZV80_32485 [Streptomyces sp. NPDC005132]|uniref:hypothetical protein n=1 Tax=Streptomyces sp. NPDC005132 TaxID=3154294 RepID=UPI0033BF9F5D
MMHTLPLQQIRTEADRFRRAILTAIDHDALGDVLGAFNNFPKGSCGKTTAMLCNHLEKEGLGAWRFVTGWQSQGVPGEGRTTHAWAALDGVVLDITGSQFPDRPEIWLGEPDDWFAQWDAEPPQPAYWDFDPANELGRAWQLVTQYL